MVTKDLYTIANNEVRGDNNTMMQLYKDIIKNLEDAQSFIGQAISLGIEASPRGTNNLSIQNFSTSIENILEKLIDIDNTITDLIDEIEYICKDTEAKQ